MSLRLVLISLVAGLGLGLPSWPTIEGWVAGTQSWMNERLAAEDRAGDRRVVIHDLLAAEMQRAHAARQARRIAPPAAPRPAIIAVAHSTAPRRPAIAAVSLPIALPKLDDYLSAAAAVPAAPEVSAARPDDLAALAWDRIGPEAAGLAATLAEGLRAAADRDRDARAFVAMEESGELYFEEVPAPAVVAEPAPLPEMLMAAIEGPEPAAIADAPAPLPDFAAMEQGADLYFAGPIVDEPALAPEALAAEAPEPIAVEEALGLADLPADVFAPTEPIVALAAPEAAPAAPEVNRAVRLTGEALSAWINVLTGPALLTASHGGPIAR